MQQRITEHGYHMNDDGYFVSMYHGVVSRGRGVERDIEAMSLLPKDYLLVVLGNGDKSYISSLKKLCNTLDVEDRVVFHPEVPRDGLEAYVAAADVGLVTVEAISKSYYYMLPNKFFENVQAETPLIASNFPETERLITKYGIGLTCNPSNPKEIAKCVRRLREDNELYTHIKESLKVAKQELCWENERKVLDEAYRRIILS